MSTASGKSKLIEFSAHGMSCSFAHLQEFAKNKNLDWEIELFPAYDEDLLAGANGALVDFNMADQIFSNIATVPAIVRDLECFDSFIFEDGRWYPRIFLFKALRALIVEKVRDLDVRSCGYVIGDNEEARIAAGVMANLGFSRIYLVGENDEALHQITARLRRKFIGVEFGAVAAAGMTMQTVQASLMINCADLENEQALLSDLSYFNFMKRQGLVVDLGLSEKNGLLEEAQRAELHILPGVRIMAERDLVFLKKCGLVPTADEVTWTSDFMSSWQTFLKSHPSSSYKKRHS